jgi:L-rhamnose mutarotase
VALTLADCTFPRRTTTRPSPKFDAVETINHCTGAAVMRYCFHSTINPQHLAVYRERHASVWPPLLEALRDAGWRNYSLFLGEDGLLVGYFEADDKDLAQASIAATQVNVRWQAEMAGLFAGEGSPDQGFTYLAEVFHLEDQLQSAGLALTPQGGDGVPASSPS